MEYLSKPIADQATIRASVRAELHERLFGIERTTEGCEFATTVEAYQALAAASTKFADDMEQAYNKDKFHSNDVQLFRSEFTAEQIIRQFVTEDIDAYSDTVIAQIFVPMLSELEKAYYQQLRPSQRGGGGAFTIRFDHLQPDVLKAALADVPPQFSMDATSGRCRPGTRRVGRSTQCRVHPKLRTFLLQRKADPAFWANIDRQVQQLEKRIQKDQRVLSHLRNNRTLLKDQRSKSRSPSEDTTGSVTGSLMDMTNVERIMSRIRAIAAQVKQPVVYPSIHVMTPAEAKQSQRDFPTGEPGVFFKCSADAGAIRVITPPLPELITKKRIEDARSNAIWQTHKADNATHWYRFFKGVS